LGQLYAQGLQVDWRGFDRDYARRRLSLPTYPFQRQRHWIETMETKAPSERAVHLSSQTNGKCHPLLGQRLEDLAAHPRDHFWQAELGGQCLPYVDGHRMWDSAVLSVGAYVDMALAAAGAVFTSGSCLITDLELHKLLLIPRGSTRIVQVALSENADGSASFRAHSRPSRAGPSDQAWILHATGTIQQQ